MYKLRLRREKTLTIYSAIKSIHILLSVMLLLCYSGVAQNNTKPPVVVPVGKPTVITIPTRAGNEYIYTISRGQKEKIILSPPQTVSPSFLKNEKGETIQDKEGNPIVLGAGGAASFTNYTTDNGLAMDAVSCVITDHSGNLWIGSNGGGLSRYDGQSFTNYSIGHGLADNSVNCMYEDSEGRIWIGTNNGLSIYTGKLFINYTTNEGLVNNEIRNILGDRKGNIWLCTEGGISSCNSKSLFNTRLKFINYTAEQGLMNNYVRCVEEDRAGNLWFGLSGGLCKFDGKKFTTYSGSNGFPDAVITSICEDISGKLWIGTGGGLYCYDISNSTEKKNLVLYTTEQGLANNVVKSIFEDKKNNLWIGTNGGISCYDGKTFTSYTRLQGLGNNMITDIAEDKTGNLWFGTYTGGISRFDGKAFTNYTKAHGLKEVLIFSIYQDTKEQLWFGTYDGGLISYNEKTLQGKKTGFTNYNIEQGLPDVTVRSICEDKNKNLWFGTNGLGISCYNGKSFVNYTTEQGLTGNVVVTIIEDRFGNLWMGTDNNGVSRFDGKSFTNYTTDQGLPSNSIFAIHEDKAGNIWFGTGKGLSCYNAKQQTGKQVFKNYSINSTVSANTILCIFEDVSENLWLGTYGGGLFRFDGKSFTNYTQQHGLPDNVITQIITSPLSTTVAENATALIVGSNSGLGALIGWKDKNGSFIPFEKSLENVSNDQLNDYSPVFKIYNSSNGFPVKDVNLGQNAMYKDKRGIIWIATGSDKTGLARFDPLALNHSAKPLTVLIKEVKVNEESICWHYLENTKGKNDSLFDLQKKFEEITTYGKELSEEQRKAIVLKFGTIQFDSISNFYPLPVNLVLPYKHNNITFDFAAPEPAKPYLVRYQYMLEGYNDEWGSVTSKTSATFGNIPEGFYTFKLKAQSSEGVWSEPVSYGFTVLPPVYRTWWAYCIYLISFSGLLYALFRWRTKALLKDKEMLEQTVKERTSEILKQNLELEKLSIVASETDNGVLICGPTGEIEWSNAALTRLLGYTFEEMKQRGKTLQELSSNPDITKLIHQSIETKKSTTYQVLNTTKSGNERWMHSTLTPILDISGNIKKLVVIDTDITERKKTDDEIKQKNQKITDSINYALRIQQAILPSQEMITGILPDSFIFFKPKDIVSGDFYWAHAIDQHQILFAAVDCTGHGVPGALMSIMGYNLLEQIVKEQKIYEPAAILNELSKSVVKSLKQTDQIGAIKEGMDIALCKIDYRNFELEYAGAHNPLYLIRNGSLIQIKASSRAIGISLINSDSFINHKIKLEKGDCIYIFSDGYADQKGGPKNQKFFYQPFRQLLTDMHRQSMEKQGQNLEDVINDWKGEKDQIDDMLVIGVRV